jgi:osmotically-inducible protein OsmY
MTTTTVLRFALAVLLLLSLPPGRAVAASDSPSEDEGAALAVRARLSQPDASSTIHLDRAAVTDGVARLTGSVRTRFALAEAVRVVRAIPGVRAVDVHGMRVEPNP